jgi:transposase
MYKPIPPIQESAEDLKARLKQETHPLKRPRLHVLYLLKSGQAQQRQQAAASVGVSRNSVGDWLTAYAVGGLAAMLHVKPLLGKQPALTPAQLGQLTEALAQPTGFASYGAVQQWIADELGVTMKYHAVHTLVHDKLKARLKVPRPAHPQKTRWP